MSVNYLGTPLQYDHSETKAASILGITMRKFTFAIVRYRCASPRRYFLNRVKEALGRQPIALKSSSRRVLKLQQKLAIVYKPIRLIRFRNS